MLLFALISKKKHTHLQQKHVPRLPSFLFYSCCPLPKEASRRIHPPQAASMSLAGCSPSHLPSVLTAPRFTQHPPQRSHSHTQTPTWPCIQSAIYLCKTDMHMNTHTHTYTVTSSKLNHLLLLTYPSFHPSIHLSSHPSCSVC